jgi:alkylhydroperoxidase family enzyme
LRNAGFDDDTIAALDCDWSRFDPRTQAALAYARKLTLEPQLVGDDDITLLRSSFSDPEIVELTFTISRFNATNRWTDGMGLPQDKRFPTGPNVLNTPTSEQFQVTTSLVAPTTRAPRPPLPTFEQAMRAIASTRGRSARVELPTVEQSRQALGEVIGDREPMAWERALSRLPESGKLQVATWNAIMTDEHLPARLKAEIAWLAAVHNRSWYAAGHAADRLVELGATREEVASLLSDEGQAADAAGVAHRLAAKLTADPYLITDADIAQVRQHYTDEETAQIVQVICMANLFDRFTEALGLPLESTVATRAASLQ